jgi:hypothetical protein
VIHPTQDQQKIQGVGEDDKSSSTTSQETANVIHSPKVQQDRKPKIVIDEHAKGAERNNCTTNKEEDLIQPPQDPRECDAAGNSKTAAQGKDLVLPSLVKHVIIGK